MRLGIVGHVSVDELEFEDEVLECLGGAMSYAGSIASGMGFGVIPITKFGRDLKEEWIRWLYERGVRLREEQRSERPTTRFRIVLSGGGRELFLKERCEDIGEGELEFDADGTVVSPIAGEVDARILKWVPGEFRALDPQGFLRGFEPDGRVYLKPTSPEFLRGFDVVKVDLEEAKALTGLEGLDAALLLLKLAGMVLLTDPPNRVYLLYRGGGYRIGIPKVEVRDTTGAGDLLLASFVCLYLKENDAKWALSNALAISSLALKERGIEKVDRVRGFEELGEELYDRAERFSL